MSQAVMYDSIVVGNLPAGAGAYAGYADGRWPTFHLLSTVFPHARLLSVAVFPASNAECLDIETGDATPAQAPAWTRRQHQRGVRRPVLYANAATMGAVAAAIRAAGIPRDSVRLWSAHYNGHAHICGPHSCAYPGTPACDATQWRDDAPGKHGSHVDESLLSASFFTSPHKPAPAPARAAGHRIREAPMLIRRGQGSTTPVALPDGTSHVRLFANHPATVRVDLRSQDAPSPELDLGYDEARTVAVPEGIHAIVIHRLDAGDGDVSCALS